MFISSNINVSYLRHRRVAEALKWVSQCFETFVADLSNKFDEGAIYLFSLSTLSKQKHSIWLFEKKVAVLCSICFNRIS